MWDSFAKALAAGLSVWDSKEKTKYQDRLISLRRDYHDEINKDAANRSDAVLDNLRVELCILADSFSAAVGKPNA